MGIVQTVALAGKTAGDGVALATAGAAHGAMQAEDARARHRSALLPAVAATVTRAQLAQLVADAARVRGAVFRGRARAGGLELRAHGVLHLVAVLTVGQLRRPRRRADRGDQECRQNRQVSHSHHNSGACRPDPWVLRAWTPS